MEKFIEELKDMNLEQTLERKAQLSEEIRSATEESQLEGMEERIKAIDERIAELKNLEQRKADASAINEGEAETKKIEERKEMAEVKEIRNSSKYIDAYAEYIKTGKADECRSLLTTNAEDGTIAIPDVVLGAVKTAWDNDEIMSLVTKASIKGNLKVNFEISGTDATIHTEGGDPVSEETLTEGIATLVPAYVKKWISISDEVMSMRGEEFLNYVYAELTHKIVKKMADQLVALIAALPQTATATSPSAAKVTSAPAMATVASAVGNLSDEANNPVIIMNKLTWSEFKAVQYANGYGADPFEGLKVMFNNTLPAYASASAGAVYMIVGDLGQGALANFPNGEGVEFTFDPYSKKEDDLVEVLGKEYVGLGVVACKAFSLVAKPTQG